MSSCRQRLIFQDVSVRDFPRCYQPSKIVVHIAALVINHRSVKVRQSAIVISLPIPEIRAQRECIPDGLLMAHALALKAGESWRHRALGTQIHIPLEKGFFALKPAYEIVVILAVRQRHFNHSNGGSQILRHREKYQAASIAVEDSAGGV